MLFQPNTAHKSLYLYDKFMYLILLLTDNKQTTNTQLSQAKYQNKISYHLLLCFRAENATMRFISS